MSNDSKKHRYVPQYVLRNFGTDKIRRHIYVFDKKECRAYKSSIVDAGSENYFNRLEYKGEIINFESIFQSIDNTGSLINVEKLPILSASGQTQARVKYVDESLNKLFEQIWK